MKYDCYTKQVETKSEHVCFLFSSDFTAYTYIVSTSSDTWEMKKRYRDFLDFDDMLQRKYGDIMAKVPPLPPKKIIGALSPSLVKERRASLEAYLKAVLSQPVIAASAEIVEFLEVPRERVISDDEDDDWSVSSSDSPARRPKMH
eukprot:CAMPEP_0114544522 /NCGR_PEP_ID=MMETSP0114-20121206/2922_1 /TAXON_ID=31324 /ORGANISM="Goniomonas sp, Strain m" /LENGTH=144 /DNA_ID=CAMNT_0001728909 /DNA_START=11 /DNA_END=445 /DNA_ORIENTATION=+